MSTPKRSRSFWEGLVREVEAGDSVADVARRARVKATSLSWWRWHLRRRQRELRLLPVVADVMTEPAVWTVSVCVGDVRVVVERADVAYVAALVRAVRGC